jgi:hypothetical protein
MSMDVWEISFVDGSGSGSCITAGFDISDIESPNSVTRNLVI